MESPGTAAIINNTGNKTVNKYAMDIAAHTQQKTEATSSDYASAADATKERKREPSNELTFEDMLMLMCTQLQNQSIDNTADTNDMMNQLISMTVMKSLTSLTQSVNEVELANVMNYSASLVGKEVTLGIYDDDKKFHQIYGVVEATGTYDGNQVVFVDGESYLLSSIMAVGKLPPIKPEDGGDPANGADENNENNGVAGSGAAGNNTDGDNNNTTANGAEAANEVSGKPLPEAD